MSDSARAFLAFGFIALILILTPKYLEWLSPKKEAKPNNEQVVQTPETLPPETASPDAGQDRSAAPALTAQPVERSQKWGEKTITVETPLYKTIVSTRGGGHLETFALKNFQNSRTNQNVQLIPKTIADINLRLSYINLDGDSVFITDNFEILDAPRDLRANIEHGSISLAFGYTFPSGATVTKRMTFHADSYTIPIHIEWDDPALELGINTFEISWPHGMMPTEKRVKEDETYGKVFVYQAGEIEDHGAVKKGHIDRKTLKGNTQWVAQRNKYFTAAFIADPDQPAIYGAYSAVSAPYDEGGIGTENLTHYNMAIGYNANQPVDMTLYLGPLSYFIIKDLGVDLERIMNFGVSLIRPISKLVLYSLVFLYNYIPNYGVVLILFAVFIRIATNPLTKKSALSTQKMQLVQPKVKVLQEKYKGNPKKLNKEMMALWKSEGVNPFGGCLPMLIQMPLLWALFVVFRSTIELRGAPFALWVQDLSAPDVIFTLPFSIPLYGDGVTVLALIMGITMFLQQKFSGAGANPQQKPMMYMMTAMFFLIFNTFPSGLNLYYAFSNFLNIIQQRNIRKQIAATMSDNAVNAKLKPKPAA